MPTNIQPLDLRVYNSTTDRPENVKTFTLDVAGDVSSNMTKINSWATTVNTKITALESVKSYPLINAGFISTGYYEATSTEVTSLGLNTAITLKLDKDIEGTTTLKINNLGTKSLLKIDATGNLVNMSVGDLAKNREYYFRYNGTSWVWQTGTSSDQVGYDNTTSGLTGKNVKSAIDELDGIIGDKTTLATTDKSSLVNATNEVKSNVGTLSTLTTTVKTSTVAAINENVDKINLLNTNALKVKEIGTTADWNTIISLGIYNISTINGMSNYPSNAGSYGTLVVYSYTDSQYAGKVQVYYQGGNMWHRTYYDGNWQPWSSYDDKINDLNEKLGTDYATWIDNPDYNTLTTFNRYRIGGGTHAPGGGIWYLEVNPAQNGIIYQRAKAVYGGLKGQTKERVLADGVWSDWEEIAKTSKIDNSLTLLNLITGNANKVKTSTGVVDICLNAINIPSTGLPIYSNIVNIGETSYFNNEPFILYSANGTHYFCIIKTTGMIECQVPLPQGVYYGAKTIIVR